MERNMTDDELEVIGLGKAVERLRANEDFKRVIEHSFIQEQALSIGKSFNGLQEQVDTLKGITLLDRYLQSLVDSAIIIQTNNK